MVDLKLQVPVTEQVEVDAETLAGSPARNLGQLKPYKATSAAPQLAYISCIIETLSVRSKTRPLRHQPQLGSMAKPDPKYAHNLVHPL